VRVTKKGMIINKKATLIHKAKSLI
ncbi:uncharacterized protein METZ01_LOCUS355164, partial [marine metagenome]